MLDLTCPISDQPSLKALLAGRFGSSPAVTQFLAALNIGAGSTVTIRDQVDPADVLELRITVPGTLAPSAAGLQLVCPVASQPALKTLLTTQFGGGPELTRFLAALSLEPGALVVINAELAGGVKLWLQITVPQTGT